MAATITPLWVQQLMAVAEPPPEPVKRAPPEKICPRCNTRPCTIIPTTGVRAAYCVECRRGKNREYKKK